MRFLLSDPFMQRRGRIFKGPILSLFPAQLMVMTTNSLVLRLSSLNVGVEAKRIGGRQQGDREGAVRKKDSERRGGEKTFIIDSGK